MSERKSMKEHVFAEAQDGVLVVHGTRARPAPSPEDPLTQEVLGQLEWDAHNAALDDDDDFADTYELMMGKPDPRDFEPCEKPCPDPDCPCHYRDDR